MASVNSFRLLALKCDAGYIKQGGSDGPITNAPLAKASVFPMEQEATVEKIYQQLAHVGVSGLKKVILHVSEEDDL
jgi:hypothetical protein